MTSSKTWALTLWVCPVCGHAPLPHRRFGPEYDHSNHDPAYMEEVRAFREADVLPLVRYLGSRWREDDMKGVGWALARLESLVGLYEQGSS